MPKTYEMEAFNRAQELYIAGQPLERIVETMRREGFGGPSKPTLCQWVNEGNWKEIKIRTRAAQARAQGDETLESLYMALEKAREAVQENGGAKAITTLVKVSEAIARHTGGRQVDKAAALLDFFKRFTDYLKAANDQEGLALLEKHFDGFIAFVKKDL